MFLKGLADRIGSVRCDDVRRAFYQMKLFLPRRQRSKHCGKSAGEGRIQERAGSERI